MASDFTTQSLDGVHLVAKVAHLYHTHGLRQKEIGERLNISQSKVSRLLTVAVKSGVVRTTIVTPRGLYLEIEEQLERQFGLRQAYVIGGAFADERELIFELGAAAAAVMQSVATSAEVIGFTSWSRSLRAMVKAMTAVPTAKATQVVELLGDVGPPALQHEASQTTEQLAAHIGAHPIFLREPGVVSNKRVRTALLELSSDSQIALRALDHLDLALVGVGTCEIIPPLRAGANFFSASQFAEAVARGAVGEINLRFIDQDGRPVHTPLDDLVIGITLDQLRASKLRRGEAGGRRKLTAVRAALVGGWINILVTNIETAQHLLAADKGGTSMLPLPVASRG